MSAQRREDLHALCALDEDTTSSTASANTAAPDADTIVADDVAKTANADAQLRPASSSGSADPLLGSCGALSAPSVCNVRLAVAKQRPLMLCPAEKRTVVRRALSVPVTEGGACVAQDMLPPSCLV